MIEEYNSVSGKRCTECGSTLLIQDTTNAEVVCGSCGYVLKTSITDQGPEWRAYTPQERKEKIRVGAPQTFMLHDKGLSTKIDWRDISGFSPEKRAELHRIRKWQQRGSVSSSIERSFAAGLAEIKRVTDRLNIPKNIVETSAVNYRKVASEGLTRGRSIKSIATACTYLACRQNKIVRTIEEFSNVSGVDKKELAANYRFLVRQMKIFVPPVKPNQQITKLANQIGLNGVTEGVAHKLLQGAKEQRLTSGRGSTSIAAAACYIAARLTGEYRTQREVGEAVDLTEVTIRNRYKEMMKKLNIVISL